MVWKLSRPERDSNPPYPAWKSSAQTTQYFDLSTINTHKILILNGISRAQWEDISAQLLTTLFRLNKKSSNENIIYN